MNIVLLDGERIENAAALHETFAEALGFPEYYGKNLDALYDLLTERAEPAGVVLCNTERLERNLGSYYRLFLRVLRDAAEENPALRIAFPFEPAEEE